MAKRWIKKLVLAKIEDSSGTAETLERSDAVQCTNIEITPIAGETVGRELERPYYGSSPEINVAVHASISFSVELASGGLYVAGDSDIGSKTAGHLRTPAWSKLARACGMSVTETGAGAARDSILLPTSAESPTLTISLNIDGVLHTLAGCRGTWSLDFAAGAIPRMRYTFLGQYANPSDTPAVTQPHYGPYKAPVVPSHAATPTFSLGGTALALSQLTLDFGAETAYRDQIGLTPAITITDRQPSGQLTLDAQSVATFPLVQRAKEGWTGALALVHGTENGKTIKIDMPRVALSQPSYQEASKIWQHQVGFRPLPSGATGDDEIKITAT